MRWPWTKWREEREALRRAEGQLREARVIRQRTASEVATSRNLRNRNGFGEALEKAMGRQ